jgi:hypothetical protein
MERQKRRRSRVSFLLEDIGTWAKYIAVGTVVALLAGGILIFSSTGSLKLGTGAQRSEAERNDLISSGNCAVYANGRVAGRIIADAGPSRGNPNRRYHVADLDRRHTFVVNVAEVRMVQCSSLSPRNQPRGFLKE